MAQNTISYQEHYVLLEFYQKKLKEKKEEINSLKDKLAETSAKLENLKQNQILT